MSRHGEAEACVALGFLVLADFTLCEAMDVLSRVKPSNRGHE